MTHVPHELHEMFPDKAEAIHRLKGENAHFAKLADAYHETNRAVHRMENNIEPVSDETLENTRKQRLRLLDEIAAMLTAA